jgi:hypothetical protein
VVKKDYLLSQFNDILFFKAGRFLYLKRMENMYKLNMPIPDGMSQDKALEHIKKKLDDLKARYRNKIKKLHEDWNGNTYKFNISIKNVLGSSTGTMIIRPKDI